MQGKLSLNGMKDPSTTRENDTDAGKFWLAESGIRERFAGKIRNPGLWNPEYSLRNPESHLTIRIRNPGSTGRESGTQCLPSGFNGLESRVQDSLPADVLWGFVLVRHAFIEMNA